MDVALVCADVDGTGSGGGVATDGADCSATTLCMAAIVLYDCDTIRT